MGDSSERYDTLARRLMTTGLLVDRELKAARATTAGELEQWIAGKGILPASIVNQALGGDDLKIGRYSINGRVGVGGMGAVLKARDESLQRDVALKVLPQSANAEDLGRFRTEAKALATLNHPNVVRIYSFEVESGAAFFVMQLVEGPSLEKRLNSGPPLDEEEAWRLLSHSVQALAHAEEHGILHRDVKPGNILCESDGNQITYRLCDFGLARLKREDGRITQAGFTIGTPAYMSPEQARGKELDSRSDMFSLSLSMYQALTGKIPFERAGDPIAVMLTRRLQEDVPDVRELREEVSKEMADLLKLLAARDPAQRPGTWQEVLGLLKARSKRASAPVEPARRSTSGVRVRPKPKARPVPVPLIAMAVIGVSTLLGVGVASMGGGSAPVLPDDGTPDTSGPVASATNAEDPQPDVAVVDTAQETKAPGGDGAVKPPPTEPKQPDGGPTPESPPDAVQWKPIDSDTAYRIALQAAEADDPGAMHVVGLYHADRGQPIAAKWLRKAAKAGHLDAMVRLGQVLRAGQLGIKQDRGGGRDWYRVAAEKGHARAAYLLALAWEEEKPDLARSWMEKAVERKEPEAERELGRMLLNGIGGEKNVALALSHYTRAASVGDPEAKFQVGRLLIDGEGVAHDPAEAARALKDAARTGHAQAHTYLGLLATEGRGVPKDLKVAKQYFEEAARRGDLGGMYQLAVVLISGLGVERQVQTGVAWLKQAAEGKHPPAMAQWGRVHALGVGVEPSLTVAVTWYQKAADAGDPYGMTHLAWAYENGKGVDADDVLADRWYRAAAATGLELAVQRLRRWERLSKVEIEEGYKQVYPQRFDRKAVRRYGGSDKTEAAVSAALDWLARHQTEAGGWKPAAWRESCTGKKCQGPGAADGEERFEVGLSALAILPFLGRGHTHAQPTRYRPQVRRALAWLLEQQNDQGLIGFDPAAPDTLYNHALATLVLCEAYGMTGDAQLQGPAEAAIAAVHAAQTPGLGWKYGLRTGKNDTSMTGWMAQALRAGKEVGFPSSGLTGAEAWFRYATDAQGNGGYESAGQGSAFLVENKGKFDRQPVMTAVALLGRLEAGASRRDGTLRKGAKILLEDPPVVRRRKLNFYYWYYGSYALFRMSVTQFKRWNKGLKNALVPSQRTAGCAEGSWDPLGEWCLAGGRVYATAINALSLEVYYRTKR